MDKSAEYFILKVLKCSKIKKIIKFFRQTHFLKQTVHLTLHNWHSWSTEIFVMWAGQVNCSKLKTLQTSDGTNPRLKNVGQEKRLTRINVGLVQTSDWYKRRIVQTSNQYKRRTIRKKKYLNFKTGLIKI